MRRAIVSVIFGLLFIQGSGCAGKCAQHSSKSAKDSPSEIETTETTEISANDSSPEVDAVSGASVPFYDKSTEWKTENLLAALRDHTSWTSDVFFAIATVDGNGQPNIASIVPYALTDDIFVFANRKSATRKNIETRGECFAIFRTTDSKTADPKKLDFFGVVGNRMKLELIDDSDQLEKLWDEYKKAGLPISPPHFTDGDHFFMKVVEILPIG